MLQRTQLMLDDQLKQDLLELAELTNRSMSDLVREFVAEKVEEKKKKKKPTAGEALLALAEAAKKLNFKGPRDLARNHDRYLY